MPDINTYALSLQLNLESNAPVVLDDVSERLGAINDQISEIAKNYTATLTPVLESIAELGEEHTTRLEDQLKTTEQTTEVMETMLEQTEGFREAAENWQAALDDNRDIIRDTASGVENIATNTDKAARGFFDIFLGIEAIKEAFAAFLELEELFITANYRLYGAQEEILGQVNNISAEYGVLRETAIEATKTLAISLRVPREELGKYVAQVSMFERVTGASIEITSEWIRKMTLAGWTARDTESSLRKMSLMMRAAGFTTAEVNKILSKEIDQSATLWFAFGTQGMEAIQNVKRELLALTRAHHGDTEALQELLDASTSNIATMGLLTQRAQNYREQLAAVAPHERAAAELKWGLFDVITQLRNEYGDLSGVTRQHLVDMAQSNAALSAYGGLFATHGDAIAKVAQSWQDFETPEEFMAALAEIQEAQDGLDTFAEAMNTVSARWREAVQPLFMAWINLMIALKPVMLLIVDLIGVLVEVLAFFINTLAAIINPIVAFKRNLEGVNEAGEASVGFFKRLGSGVLNLALALPGLILGIATLVGLYFGLRLVARVFANWVNQMRPANLMAVAAAFWAMGTSMLMMATALAIIAALGWKAAGALVVLTAAMAGMVLTITFLANVARTATVPLTVLAGVMLAFGAASLMIAGSLWVIAEAMKTMADMGWALVGAVVAVAAILGVMAGALLLMSTVGAPAIPLMLAVGAAFLMMGAAIWMTAAAFEMIVNSFGKLGESAMQVVENAGALFAAVGIISAALLALAVVGAITALPLLALGVALLVVGAAAMMISSAFEAAVEVIKAFADIENVKDAIAGMTLAITAMMFTMAGIAVVLAPVLPIMLVAAGILLAVGAAAWLTAQAMDVMAGAMEKFGDMDMVIAGVAGLAVAMLGMAAVALVIAPVLPALILMGVAMMSIGAGAWLMAQGLSATVSAIQELAEIETDKILQVGLDLMAFGAMIAGAARSILWGSLVMVPATAALVYALATLNAILWLIPVSRLRAIGEAVGDLGTGFRSFASGLDMIESIAARGGSFGELATTISSALDEIEEQALRADAIADSFVRMNEAIAHVLSGPPEPVYGDVANALRDKMDAIEEQAARAEAVYAPIEGIAEQADLALAMSGEPAADAFAEPIGGAPAPGEEEGAIETSNYINLRKQTVLLEKIEAAMPPEAIANALDKLVELPGRIGDLTEYLAEHPVMAAAQYAAGGIIGLTAAAARHAGEDN